MKQNFVKKEIIDAFKTFLKETDGDLLYRIWMEIENLAAITNDDEQKRCFNNQKFSFKLKQFI